MFSVGVFKLGSEGHLNGCKRSAVNLIKKGVLQNVFFRLFKLPTFKVLTYELNLLIKCLTQSF